MNTSFEGFLKQKIEEIAPVILNLEGKKEVQVEAKREAEAEVAEMRIAIEDIDIELKEKKVELLALFEDANVSRARVPQYIVKRCQSTTPAVEVVDENAVSEEYIIRKPRIDKKRIQSDYTRTGIMPAGVRIEFHQYLIVKRRQK